MYGTSYELYFDFEQIVICSKSCCTNVFVQNLTKNSLIMCTLLFSMEFVLKKH